VELCKLYRLTVEFNSVDSTALINLGDPCKRALRWLEDVERDLWKMKVKRWRQKAVDRE